jgi:DNA-binding NtrC family response regulator
MEQDAGAARKKARVLVVDDDVDLLALLETGLEDADYEVEVCGSAERALELLEVAAHDIIISDINLPGMSGLNFCSRVVSERAHVVVMVMTAFSSIKSAVEALRAGAYDYLMKPLDLEALIYRLDRVVKEQSTQREVQKLREIVADERGFEGLLGTSAPMQKLYDLVARAGETDASVLVTGESGTGKELVARALHRRSVRSAAPFVPVNCSAIPDTLLESELFGHSQGAFTDARKSRAGLFVEATGGTLFLDEIGEIPLQVQPKLLRALEERKVRPVGSDKESEVDVRLVAATNRDLEAAVEDGSFREDLFFRVNVIHIHVPPLRARGGDVLLLAQSFLERYAARFGKEVAGLSSGSAERLMAYNWPGNVRELRNCIERAVALGRGPEIQVEDLPERVRTHSRAQLVVGSDDPSELAELAEIERRYILHVMEVVAGNKSLAAKTLGLDRKTLYRKLQRYTRSGAVE